MHVNGYMGRPKQILRRGKNEFLPCLDPHSTVVCTFVSLGVIDNTLYSVCPQARTTPEFRPAGLTLTAEALSQRSCLKSWFSLLVTTYKNIK